MEIISSVENKYYNFNAYYPPGTESAGQCSKIKSLLDDNTIKTSSRSESISHLSLYSFRHVLSEYLDTYSL